MSVTGTEVSHHKRLMVSYTRLKERKETHNLICNNFSFLFQFLMSHIVLSVLGFSETTSQSSNNCFFLLK